MAARPRALILTHVPLNPAYPNGFSARWHSFVEEVGKTFDLDVICVRGIWDNGTLDQATFVPALLQASRVRLLEAVPDPPPASLPVRVVQSLRVLTATSGMSRPVPALRAAIEEPPEPALVVVFLSHMAEPFLRARIGAPCVFVLEEAFHRMQTTLHAQMAEHAAAGALKRCWKEWYWSARHRRAAAGADRAIVQCGQRGPIVAISHSEATYFARVAPQAEVIAMPIGVDIDHYAPRNVQEDIDIALFGDFAQHRNYGPARELYEAMRSRERFGDLRWAFVGREPHASLRALTSERVLVTGTVPDTRPYYARARIVAAPAELVTGGKTTVLKACSMGKAVVTNRIGAESLALEPGAHVVAAADIPAMATAIESLLRDDSGRERLGKAARAAVVRDYDQRVRAREFHQLCLRAASML